MTMGKAARRCAIVLAFGGLASLGCGDGGGGGDDDGGDLPDGGGDVEGARIETRLVTPPGVAALGPAIARLGQSVGTDPGTGLTSLQYYLSFIQIAAAYEYLGDVQVSGP